MMGDTGLLLWVCNGDMPNMRDAYYKVFVDTVVTDGLTPEQQAELAAILRPRSDECDNSMTAQPALLDRQAARKYLGGISDTTIWRLAKRGLLHPVQIGTRIMFEQRDLERCIRKCRCAKLSGAGGRSLAT